MDKRTLQVGTPLSKKGVDDPNGKQTKIERISKNKERGQNEGREGGWRKKEGGSRGRGTGCRRERRMEDEG